MKSWNRNKVFTIAEIGGNHEGNYEKAKKLLNLAAETGFDAIKFQIYKNTTLVNHKQDVERSKHFKKFQLTKNQYIKLAKLTKSYGLQFMASIWDLNEIDIFDKFIDIHKIGSGDLTAYPFVKKLVSKNKPLIISTGLSTINEIIETIGFINEINSDFIKKGKLALMQCTSMYPIPDRDASLNSMKFIADKTKLPVGYSDHTIGSDSIDIAIAMGASIIEEHFTDNREKHNFRDHKVSLTKNEMKKFIKKIKKIKIIQGKYEKKIMQSEKRHLKSFRRAVYFNKNLKKNSIIKESDLVVLRPCEGISAKYFYDVIGKKLNRDVSSLQRIYWRYLI